MPIVIYARQEIDSSQNFGWLSTKKPWSGAPTDSFNETETKNMRNDEFKKLELGGFSGHHSLIKLSHPMILKYMTGHQKQIAILEPPSCQRKVPELGNESC